MKRYFNTDGACRLDIHYMVRIDERLEQLKRMYVDKGKYFIINRGRQYGKTTTLKALAVSESDVKYEIVIFCIRFLISER